MGGKKTLYLLLAIIMLGLLNGCSASVLIPPLPGPFMIPSTIGTAFTAYSIGADERDFQTIVEDEMIETSVQSAILSDKELDLLDLSTYSYNGHVYVVGEYEKKADFQRIRNIVRKCKKTNSLTTYLFANREVPGCSSADDYMLQLAVKGALLEDPTVWGTNFSVKSVQCNIVLLGRVGSKKEAVAARRIAARVKGVRAVKSFIRSSSENHYHSSDRTMASIE